MPSPPVSSHVRLPPFQALLDAHGRDVHRFLVATVGSVDADDCYQEAWLAALRAYPKLRDGSNLRAWIFTIAHRKAVDNGRARCRRPLPVAEIGERAGREAAADVPGGDGLWDQVAALPDKQRTALALRFLTDAAYAEIAVVMAISPEAARRNVHEGLKRLRKEYRP